MRGVNVAASLLVEFGDLVKVHREPSLPISAPQRDAGIRTISWGGKTPPSRDHAGGLENPANLLRRLKTLQAALDDLPRQAKRLVRALARRQKSPQLKFKMPLRPGRAPGWRRKPALDIDHVLHQCEWLAREALPDTS